MAAVTLNETEARVVGCLIEKSIVTPDQYPLTLNALVNACNQKSSRDPVMSLTQGEVQGALRALEGKHLVRSEESSRAEKYTQRLCNTRYSELQLDSAEIAIICLLLLRGRQTPGELRSRSGRLHSFDDNSDVVSSLEGLVDREPDPLVVKLPRTAGRKDSEFMHLLSGPVDVEAYAAAAKLAPSTPKATAPRGDIAALSERVDKLEAELASLKAQLGIDNDD